jgi:flagellin
MGLRVNHNIQSLNAHRALQSNDMAVGRSLQRLSSGLRINSAADDAAGLVISEQMRAQINSTSQAIDNTETAVNMVQTAEGALDEVNSLLSKMRELALHAANEAPNDVTQLAADQAELDNAIGSITRIANQTQFGTKKLLDGTLAATQGVNLKNILNVKASEALLTRGDFFPGDVTMRLEGSREVVASVGLNGTVISGLFIVNTSADGSDMSIASFFADDTTRLRQGTTLEISIVDKTFVFGGGTTVAEIKKAINGDEDSLYTVQSKTGSAIFLARFGGSNGGVATDINVKFTRSSIDSTGSVDIVSLSLQGATVGLGSYGYNTILRFSTGQDGSGVVSFGNGSVGTAAVFTSSDDSSTAASAISATFGVGTSKLNIGSSATFEIGGTKYTFSNRETVSEMINAVNKAQDEYTLRSDLTNGLVVVRNDMGEKRDAEGDVAITVANNLGRTFTLKYDSVANSSIGSIGRNISASLTGAGLPGGAMNLIADSQDSSILRSRDGSLEIKLDQQYARKAELATSEGFSMQRGALFQVGANGGQNAAIDMGELSTKILGNGADSTKTLANLQDLVDKQSLVNGFFTQSLDVIDSAINEVTTLRGTLGAFQANTLESNLNSLRVGNENLTAAESTIRDVDMAAESAEFSKNQILLQAATAMMAQANQLPNNVLQLLG